MTDRLRFSRAQIRNAAIIAKNEGVRIKLGTDGSIFVFPDSQKPLNLDADENTDLDRELAAFEARHGYS